MVLYIFGQVAVAVFAITGVLGAVRKNRDLLGLTVLGVITALGGGTLRDTILDVPVFWIQDPGYVYVAGAASIITFFLLKLLRVNINRYRLLLYLDGLGVAYFCIQAFDKSSNLGHGFMVGLVMAMLTGMAGGVMRDVLTGRPNLLITTELYATPALLGTGLYGMLRLFLPGGHLPEIIGIIFIFVFRSLAIYLDLHMPHWLINKQEHS